MRHEAVTRRRAISILAATAASVAASARPTAATGATGATELEWRGLAMGTDARIVFCGATEDKVRVMARTIVAEIERLERALSLFRADSDICRLNRTGSLTAPSGDLCRALALALAIAEATGGLFDPTVQALWEAHVDWFSLAPTAALPPDGALAAARTAVDWRKIRLTGDCVALGPGQRITLNGLGQGYVTDRIADLLRAHGFEHVLVDLGEQRALGPRNDRTPWWVERGNGGRIALVDGALATSEGAGCILGAAGAAHHLFDPRSGRSAQRWRRITVHHRSAAVADALSTALYAASAAEIATLVTSRPRVAVWATDRDGRDRHWGRMPT